MATFDRTQPYGQIANDEFGRCYEQNGAFFLGNGDEWRQEDTAVAKRGKAKAAPVDDPAPVADPAPSPVDEQLAAQLGESA